MATSAPSGVSQISEAIDSSRDRGNHRESTIVCNIARAVGTLIPPICCLDNAQHAFPQYYDEPETDSKCAMFATPRPGRRSLLSGDDEVAFLI